MTPKTRFLKMKKEEITGKRKCEIWGNDKIVETYYIINVKDMQNFDEHFKIIGEKKIEIIDDVDNFLKRGKK